MAAWRFPVASALSDERPFSVAAILSALALLRLRERHREDL